VCDGGGATPAAARSARLLLLRAQQPQQSRQIPGERVSVLGRRWGGINVLRLGEHEDPPDPFALVLGAYLQHVPILRL